MKCLSKDMLEKLTSEYGDSFYILDSDVFEDNCCKLIAAFKKHYSNFNIAYSYKTNYTPKLVKMIDRLGGLAEVVSDMEVDIALHSGIPYERIIWNGPVKNIEKVQEVLLNGGTVNIDSYEEFVVVKKLATENQGANIRIGIRCNYDVGDGVISRFGVDTGSKEFDIILTEIRESKNVELICFQAHFAKRNPEFWSQRTEGMLSVYKYAKEKYGIIPKRIDLGGGIFGTMPDNLREQLGVAPVCFEDYAVRSAKLLSDVFKDSLDAPMLLIEPGTAVAANCMRYVCRIKTIKQIRGKSIASTNGSQKNISISGINPPMEIIKCGPSRKYYSDIDIAGYTCIESDYLYRNFTGEVGAGDYVVIGNCGSYSLVMKPPFIFTNVPVIDISGDEVEVIKRAEKFSDLFATYTF